MKRSTKGAPPRRSGKGGNVRFFLDIPGPFVYCMLDLGGEARPLPARNHPIISTAAEDEVATLINQGREAST